MSLRNQSMRYILIDKPDFFGDAKLAAYMKEKLLWLFSNLTLSQFKGSWRRGLLAMYIFISAFQSVKNYTILITKFWIS